MKVLSSERQELIDALVAESAMGGITAGLLEKDEHLTDALRALFALRLGGLSLVFCGGTSLSMRRAMGDAYKVQAMTGTRLGGWSLLHAATRGAAVALGLAHEIGSLEAGLLADGGELRTAIAFQFVGLLAIQHSSNGGNDQVGLVGYRAFIALEVQADYAATFAELAKEVRTEHHKLDERLARIESTSDRAVAAEAAEHALAALAGLRSVAARLDTDVAIAEARAGR